MMGGVQEVVGKLDMMEVSEFVDQTALVIRVPTTI